LDRIHPTQINLAEHSIVEPWKKVAIRNIDERRDWFQENKTSVLKQIEERNDAQYELTKKTPKENLEKLQGGGKAPKKEKRQAKMR
jgi:hypothetical protein